MLEGENWYEPDIATVEFWRWKTLIAENAKGEAEQIRRANPEWYSK